MVKEFSDYSLSREETPRYKPGDKITGGVALPDNGPFHDLGLDNMKWKGSLFKEPVNAALDIYWRSLRSKFAPDVYAGFAELPKPEKFYQLHRIVSEVLPQVFPGVEVMKPEQMMWFDTQSFKEDVESAERDETISMDRLYKLGLKPSPRYKDGMYHYIHPGEPARASFNGNSLRSVDDEDDPREKTLAEYAVLKLLIHDSIWQTRQPRFVPYDNPEIARLFSRQLDQDLRALPKYYPSIDRDGLREMATEYRKKLTDENGNLKKAEEEGILIETDGASVQFVQKTDGQYEPIIGIGVELNKQIEIYLTMEPLEKALIALAETVPPEYQHSYKERYKTILRKDLNGNAGRAFLGSIGINTPQEAAQAYFDSTIFEKYLEAKKKRKNLEYPI